MTLATNINTKKTKIVWTGRVIRKLSLYPRAIIQSTDTMKNCPRREQFSTHTLNSYILSAC